MPLVLMNTIIFIIHRLNVRRNCKLFVEVSMLKVICLMFFLK